MYERSDTDPALNYHLISDTWFVKFMRTLSRGVRVADVQNIFKNVVFVNFNYDRCLEYFLLLALRAQFGLNDTDASQILSTLKILRPYGKVGPLTTLWSSNEVRFGAPKKSSMMKHTDLIDQIKTFSECLSEETDLADIRAEVAKAQCLVFLGFAFHDQNIRILKPNGPMNQIHVFATALGMSDDDANFTTGQIMRFFDNPTKGLIRVKNKLTCNGLFDHYGHSIAG
jgi:hypothetical protein